MDWFWALLIVIVGNIALFAALVLAATLVRKLRTRE